MNKLTVVVTRPDPAGSSLCAAIREAGDIALHVPTITFLPAQDQKQLDVLFSTISSQDWLIFVSPQAVYESVPRLRAAALSAVKIAAVGGGTARALNEAGFSVAACPDEVWSAEGLLAMPVFQAPVGKKIAIMRGVGGRELLEPVLQARGAIVTPIVLYQRAMPKQKIEPAGDVIICASFTAVDHLKKMAGDDAWPVLQTIPLIVMSERIKTLAHDLGFRTIWVTKHPGHLAIMETIAQKRNEICQKKQTKL